MDPFGLGFDPQSVSQVAAVAVPYIVEAARSLGARIWTRAEDAAIEGTASWGRRLARKIRGEDDPGQNPAVVGAVDDVVADPDDPDTHAALRVQVGKALAASPELLAEIGELLKRAQQTTASGDRSVAGTITNSVMVTGDRSVGQAGGPAITGDGNTIGNWPGPRS